MFQTQVPLLLFVISIVVPYGCANESDIPKLGAAVGICEFQVTGTSQPPSSGTPTVISEITGTVISANFFNSGAIDPPHFDGNESVSICVTTPDINGNRTAEITTDVGLDNDFNIKAYPQFVVGTKFGNIFETSYRYYPNTGLPAEHQWPVTSSNLSNQSTPFEFANLEYVSSVKGVGLPAFTSNLPNISITLDIDEANVVGAERDVMLETWFYDTSANASIIGNNVATGQPIANTLNNIVGVGHPHYDELDNTLLEMMVHLGALSPHDVSEANNNPGQNQLTEVFSGKDFDLDGIDDHFDVDSHAFLNSSNPADPQPGLYSSGIDNNGDGIDDADLLPVQMGEHLYSIWYGQSFLSPIVIYSRETNTSLQNDFDPNTPDMNLTTEGEITLPWNEFLDFTLTDIQPLLQTAGVTWATGIDNIFQKMSSSGGAISGLEFGVEPQTNNPVDQPYTLLINEYNVKINGRQHGLTKPDDNDVPVANITIPEANDAILPTNAAFSGTATDTGGSGFRSVRVAIRNVDLSQWYNFSNSSFTGAVGNGSIPANLANTTASTTDWNYSLTLAPGNYALFTVAVDNAGNASSYSARRFSVLSNDTLPPSTSISTPSANNVVLPSNTSISGTATDAGGSGFRSVRVAIRNVDLSQWYNFSNNSFTGAVGNGSIPANLTNTTANTTDWNYSLTLPTGNYVLFTVAVDNSGNTSSYINRRFSVLPNDTQAPSASISIPSANDVVLPTNASFSGTATDAGGSGFKSVRVAIRNVDLSQWYNFSNNSFTGAIGNGSTPANLTNKTASTTDWNYSLTLPTGNYVLFTVAVDNSGNASSYTARRFLVLPNDTQAPSASISTPSANDEVLPTNASFSGTATDAGGSGFRSVRVAVRSVDLSQWYNFANSSFSGAIGNGSTPATLTGTTTSATNWNYSVTLPTGNYVLFTVAVDNSGNASSYIARRFTILPNDTIVPTASISSPAANDAVLPNNASFSGTATDTGGSGFRSVRVAIRSVDLSQWYNFSNNSFSGAIGNGSTPANLTNTTSNATDWDYSLTLPTGNYVLFTVAVDNSGNASSYTARRFSTQ